MRYFTKGLDTATAETDASATRLVARGYTRCSAEAHRAAWQERDRQARAELRKATPEAPPAPVPEIRHDVVYPSSWKH